MTEARKRADFIEPTSVGIGVKADSDLIVDEQKGLIHRTLINLVDEEIAIIDTGGANGGYGSKKLMDLPKGNILFLGATTRLTSIVAAAGIGVTAAVKHSVGSAAEATNDTLDSVQANIVPSTSITLAASAGSGGGASTGQTVVDGRSSAADIVLNFGVADAGISANSSVTVSGQVEVFWLNLGA